MHKSPMVYRITPYTRKRARALGVVVQPSRNKKKKIDVFDKTGARIAAVGANGMMDYPTYVLERGSRYANTRRQLYYQRHSKDGKTKASNGWWAKRLLW